MEDQAAERKKQVQRLRKVAKRCGIGVIRDDANKDQVLAFAQSIADSGGSDSDKTLAESALAAYKATWPVLVRNVQGAAPRQPKPFRFRGASFLLTFNWQFLARPLPDGAGPYGSPALLWKAWKVWKAEKKRELKVVLSTSTVEQSLKSADEDRLRIHWKVNLQVAVDTVSRDMFAFHGVLPDVRPTVVTAAPQGPGQAKKPRGASFFEASNRVHFYTWAPKRGTLYVGTNYKPFQRYRVLGKWLDDLWTDDKLDHDTYKDLALKVRVGYSSRKRDLELVLADERERRVNKRIVEVAREQEKLKAPPRFFPEVQAWEDSFLQLDFRWKILLLWADSASGKSTFAEGLFERPYLVTVEEAEHLDLKGFDFEKHDGLVLDNVNSFQQLLQWRAVLQGRNAKSKGGQSATNMYSYAQYLFAVAVVATVDLDAPDGYLVDEEHADRSKWLVKNTVLVKLPRGETFFDAGKKPNVRLENNFSLFAQTVKRRRTQT